MDKPVSICLFACLICKIEPTTLDPLRCLRTPERKDQNLVGTTMEKEVPGKKVYAETRTQKDRKSKQQVGMGSWNLERCYQVCQKALLVSS